MIVVYIFDLVPYDIISYELSECIKAILRDINCFLDGLTGLYSLTSVNRRKPSEGGLTAGTAASDYG